MGLNCTDYLEKDLVNVWVNIDYLNDCEEGPDNNTEKEV